jgi:hypothetical protein
MNYECESQTRTTLVRLIGVNDTVFLMTLYTSIVVMISVVDAIVT